MFGMFRGGSIEYRSLVLVGFMVCVSEFWVLMFSGGVLVFLMW